MILNISRGKFFKSCRQYAYNWDELRLMSHREADALIVGGGYHIGSEIISKTADVEEAKATAEREMRARYAKSMILPEEVPNIERNIEWVKHATVQWAEHYDKADFRVLWPEVKGCVAIPGTEHHCWFVHRLLHDSAEDQFDLCEDPRCRIPHYLTFRTDGVIEMYKHIWLLEQKTTAKMSANFWQKFQLDEQVRGYLYGVWKTTGVLPDGVLINAVIKHSKVITTNGVKKYQLDPTNVGFEREPVLVTKADLADFEADFIKLCNDYEEAFRTKNIYKNTNSCFSYNRQCYYFEKCKRGNAPDIGGEFRQRDVDYVENEYRKLLGLPIIEPKEDVNGEEQESEV